MATKKMGFEGEVYYGVAGATAGSKITNTRDITETYEIDEAETTVRGTGAAPPIKTFRAITRGYTLTFQTINKSTDAIVAALVTAAYNCTPVAICTKDFAGGKGVDADFNVKVTRGMPYKGEQTLDFSFSLNDDARDPLFNI